MAKYDTAKKKRDSAERKRAAAQKIINDPNKSAKQKAAAKQRRDANAKTMREQGDIMRGVTGREKGERTVYTGPLSEEGRKKRDLPDMTKWQQANVGLLGALGGDRALFRQQFTPEMQAEYMRTGKIPQGFVPPKTPKTKTKTKTKTTGTGAGTGTGGGLLGGYGSGYGYGGYPVASMGFPSGLDTQAARDAAEGYGKSIGFNVGPHGGLVYRPWTWDYWKGAGIDPALWDAPFTRGGLLGGGTTRGTTGGTTRSTTGGTGGPVPDGTKTTAETGPTFHETFMARGGGHDQALQRLYAAAGGDGVWGSYANWFNRSGNTPPSQTKIGGSGFQHFDEGAEESLPRIGGPGYQQFDYGAEESLINPSYGMPAGQPVPSYGMPAGLLSPSYAMPPPESIPVPSITAQPPPQFPTAVDAGDYSGVRSIPVPSVSAQPYPPYIGGTGYQQGRMWSDEPGMADVTIANPPVVRGPHF